jgi:ABC-type antimicrobial peptide transport system permease subunit
MYIPWTQLEEEDQPSSYTYLARVAAAEPRSIVPGVERLVREADQALRVRTATTYAAIIDRSIGVERIMAMLGGFFGVLALLVAGLGMFGILAFRVARRTNELGVRLALGASPGSMMRLVLRDVIGMFVPGVVIGAGVALMLTGLARRILFGVTPGEPGVFVVAASVLACAAILAGWLPARRASRVDPLVALRHE